MRFLINNVFIPQEIETNRIGAFTAKPSFNGNGEFLSPSVSSVH